MAWGPGARFAVKCVALAVASLLALLLPFQKMPVDTQPTVHDAFAALVILVGVA